MADRNPFPRTRRQRHVYFDRAAASQSSEGRWNRSRVQRGQATGFQSPPDGRSEVVRAWRAEQPSSCRPRAASASAPG